jgi:hypothetical protein
MDIDHFKSVNDTFGHLIGDEVLVLMARIMRTSLRQQDQLYRFGGEEFVVMMRCPDQSVADATLERWQRGGHFGARLVTSLTAWITDAKEHSLVQLGRVITLNALFAKLSARGLAKPVEQLVLGNLSYVDAENAFAKGYFKALANNLMVKQGFNTFDGAANGNFITKLKVAKGQLQDQLPKILAAELGKRRGFDASAKLGAVGDLIQALNAKRSVPIRTMLARHWDVISKLSPCVLASPDSTVRFLAADFAPFDLLVFD